MRQAIATGILAVEEIGLGKNDVLVSDFKKVFDFRMQKEQPALDVVMSESSTQQERVNFAKMYGYPLEIIIEEQNKLIGIEQ